MILVFGGGGQLGQELAAKAREGRPPLVALERSQADIAEPGSVEAAIVANRPSIVVNAAAYNLVDKAESDPETAMRTNVRGPAVLAAAAAKAGIPFIHVSTDFVFDGTKTGSYREDDACSPLGVYGLSKMRGEEAVRAGCHQHLILRTAWLFGVYGTNFVKTVLRLAGEKPELAMVEDQRGSPTSTADLADAIGVALRAAAEGAAPWGTYHVAGAGEASRYEFACHIVAAQAPFTGHAPRIKPVSAAAFQTAAKRPANAVLDSSKFARAFGYRCADWRIAVDRTVAALLSTGTRS